MSDDEGKEVDDKEEGSASEEPTLDQLLAEMDLGQVKREDTKTDDGLKSEDIRALAEFARNQQAVEAERQQTEAIADAVKVAKGDADIPDVIVSGYLREMAVKDPRIEKAFQERGQNPSAWNNALKALGKELRNTLGDKPDQEMTEDAEAVAAAVRSASTKTRETTDDVPDDIGQYSDAQFEAWLSKQ